MPQRVPFPPPIHFVLGPTPDPEHADHYNAFGISKEFIRLRGEYWQRKDREREEDRRA
jgi:LmbE family N-acetylglucosaminyl deacetylase